jgi:hypothetical protein
MAEGVRVVLVGILAVIGLTATFLSMNALFPSTVERAEHAADESAARSFWLGFVNLLFIGALGLAFGGLANGTGFRLLQIPALFLYALLAVMVTFGLTAVASLIGERLMPAAPPVRKRIWGSLLLLVGCLTPVVGWFILLPYALCLGAGGFVLSWTRQRARETVEQPEAG